MTEGKKKFRITGRPSLKWFKRTPEEFTEDNPPSWLIGGVPGSTMDNRWFWTGYVLTLAVGAHVETDFSRITRIA